MCPNSEGHLTQSITLKVSESSTTGHIMKINKSFLRIALATGLIGLAACGGSDSSSRNRNSSIATNVKRYEGTIQVSGRDFGSREKPDTYNVEFDVDLDAVSTQPYLSGPTTSHGDFRNNFSNFSIKKNPENKGSTDLSTIKWAQCPYDSYFYKSNDTSTSEFQIVLVEAPNTDIASAPCGQPAPREDKYHQAGLWTSEGEYVRPNEDARYLTFYFRDSLGDTSEDFPTLLSILKNGLDPYFDMSKNVYANVSVFPYSTPYDNNFSLSLSSTKLKDYQPYELTATAAATTIDLSWSRSADLEETDNVSYDLLWSIENSNWVESISLDDVVGYTLPACLVNPQNDLAAGTKVAVQLIAKDKAGIMSPSVDKIITISADTVQCPTTKPIAAPTGFAVDTSKKQIVASWNALEDQKSNDVIKYCVSEINPNLPDSTSEDLMLQQDSVIVDCTTETKLSIGSFRYETERSEVKYYVQAFDGSGSVSTRSEIQTITVPREENISGLTVTLNEGGLSAKWKPTSIESRDRVLLLYAVNLETTCDKYYAYLIEMQRSGELPDNLQNNVGLVFNAENFFIGSDRLGDKFVPGAKVTVCAKRLNNGAWGDSPDWSSANYTYPVTSTPTVVSIAEETTTEAPAATVAPVVEATAKTAIVTETATEVQLPAAAVEVTVKVEDVYTGFGVSASDVKSVEYQIDAGSWTAVAGSASVKIPKAASKMAIRVTKTNGEEVVSEKAIVRTEESTDTTVAESDTTAPLTTEAPASSESSSSNNTLLYILGFIIVAGAAGFFIKKKSASTK